MNTFFKLTERGSDVKTEIRAGITTFLMMAYIIVVNPGILSNAGMSFSGVLLATVLVCALSSLAMGLLANLPYGVAPGMGINAFFTFTLVLGMGISWQTALGAVFVSGLIFILLSVTGIRTEIVKAIPEPLKLGIAAGIGFFLAFIGLESVGFIVDNPATLVTFGTFNITLALFIVGLGVTAALMLKKVPGALMLGVIITSILTLLTSLVGTCTGLLSAPLIVLPDSVFAMPDTTVLFQLDISSVWQVGMIMPVFSLLFVDVFDSISSFVGISKVAGLVEDDGTPVNVGPGLLVDALSTTVSGLFGTSSGTTYVESAAGIEEGGRTGLTAVVCGLLFLPFMFVSPLLAFIPAVATAPVLVLVGVFMSQPLKEINWKNFEEAVPAFLAILLIPLTYSITQGVIWSFLVYTLIKVITGKAGDIHWMLYIIDVLAVISIIAPLF